MVTTLTTRSVSQTADYETPGGEGSTYRDGVQNPCQNMLRPHPTSEMVYETLAAWQATDHNLIGLARVSTDAQDAQLQRDALNDAGCGRIFEEKISTRKTERPGLAAALDYLRPGDTLCVWKLDRLGRSVKDLLIIADDLHEQGIGLRILTGKLAGTYSPSGEGNSFSP